MHDMQSIVAVFKDDCDAGAWAAYLDGLSALWTITADNDHSASLQKLALLGVRPAVVILSSRLYPTGNPELAAMVRSYFPAAELLLLSSADDGYPPLLQLSADSIRHLQVNSPKRGSDGKGYFESVLAKLRAGRPMTIGDRLARPNAVSVVELTGSSQKEELLARLDALPPGEGEEWEMVRQRGALLADELIENALYGAPRDAAGKQLFRKGEPRRMLPGERLVFSFAFDGETLAMEMTDNWGTLDPDLVVAYLARNQAQEESHDEIGGRGLFLIWRFFDHFHVSVYPGVKTVVGGDLALSRKLDPEAPRGFHITEHNKGDAA